MHDTNTNQVVVLGASLAGLLAARVLSERFERVVVIERDVLPPAGGQRRGVPHGRHLHGLHPRGREILDELFPGFSATLTAEGAVGCDALGDTRWQLSGHQLRLFAGGYLACPPCSPACCSLKAISARWCGDCPGSVFSTNTRSLA